jgi:hypothetical protein
MTDWRNTVVAMILCTLALALAACSGSAPQSSGASEASNAGSEQQAASQSEPAALPHPCTLLTTKDAEEVMGSGAKLTRDSETDCDLQDDTFGNILAVSIKPLDKDTWDGGEMMMTMDKEARKITDIGEGGYTFGGGTIVFKKGEAEVSVITSAYKGPKEKLEAAKIIGAKVAAALHE